MATFAKRLAVLLLALITLTGLAKCARQKSPLLVEDDNSRRNRPAGEFLCFNETEKKVDAVKQLWGNEMSKKLLKRLDYVRTESKRNF